MEIGNEILKAALLGTERQAPILPSGNDALGQIFTQLKADDREGSVLSAAAAVSLYRRAGMLPLTVTIKQEPSGKEELARCHPRALQHASLMLEGTHRELLEEWLAAAALAGKRLPEELLPQMLQAGADKHSLQELIIPILGQRGRWLAAQNKDWAYASGAVVGSKDYQSEWELSGQGIRVALLRTLRKTEPKAARELVLSSWKQDASDDRAEFVATFLPGLSMDDEPFLEECLDDKRKEVRQAASDLLARLPHSRLTLRMIDRVRPLLSYSAGKKGLLSKLTKSGAGLEVTLPGSCDKAMLRDGIQAKPSAGLKIGEKAWWLQQMLGHVPPSFWTKEWTVTADELVQVAAKSDYAGVFQEAWSLAAERFNETEWAGVLLERFPKLLEFSPKVFEILPAVSREKQTLQALAESGYALNDDSKTMTMLRGCTHEWSPQLARAFLKAMRLTAASITSTNRSSWQLRSQLREFARRFPPALHQEAGKDWPKDAKEWDSWCEPVDRFLSVITFRHEMLQALNES